MSILGKAARFVKDKGVDVLNTAAKGSTFGLVSFKGEENFSDEVKAVRADIKVVGEHVATKADIEVVDEKVDAYYGDLKRDMEAMDEKLCHLIALQSGEVTATDRGIVFVNKETLES